MIQLANAYNLEIHVVDLIGPGQSLLHSFPSNLILMMLKCG